MATKAERIVAGDLKVPKEVEQLMIDATENSNRVADGIEEAVESGELRDNVHRFAVEEALTEAGAADEPTDDQEKLISAYQEGGLTAATFREHSGLASDEARDRAQEVADDWLEGSTYAYSFHVLDDDSVLAIYVEQVGKEPKLKAFEDLSATRNWHPVRNPEA
jgi:hypothetical protein